MKIDQEKIHPTNPNLQWVERYGASGWEVKPCLNNELPDLLLVTNREQKIYHKFTQPSGKIVHQGKKGEVKTAKRNEKIKSKR